MSSDRQSNALAGGMSGDYVSCCSSTVATAEMHAMPTATAPTHSDCIAVIATGELHDAAQSAAKCGIDDQTELVCMLMTSQVREHSASPAALNAQSRGHPPTESRAAESTAQIGNQNRDTQHESTLIYSPQATECHFACNNFSATPVFAAHSPRAARRCPRAVRRPSPPAMTTVLRLNTRVRFQHRR